MAHATGIRPQILHWNMTKPIAASLKNPFISALSERPEGAEVLQVAGGLSGQMRLVTLHLLRRLIVRRSVKSPTFPLNVPGTKSILAHLIVKRRRRFQCGKR